MGRTKKPKFEASATEEDPTPHKCTYRNCRKKYATISSLNNHKRIKHSEIRWKCPFCDEEQVSKDKHNLHIKRKHRAQWQSTLNLDRNQIRRNRFTPKAQEAKLIDQQKTIDKQMDLILRYRTWSIGVKAELRTTKKKLAAANQMLADLGYSIPEEERSESDGADGIEDRSSQVDDGELGNDDHEFETTAESENDS